MKSLIFFIMLLASPSMVLAEVVDFSNIHGTYSSSGVSNVLPADTYIEYGYKFQTQYSTLNYAPLYNWKYIPAGYNGTDKFLSFYNQSGAQNPVGVKISAVDGSSFNLDSFTMLGNGQGWMLENDKGEFFTRTINNKQTVVFDALFNGLAGGYQHVAALETYNLSDAFQNIKWAEFVPVDPRYPDRVYLQSATLGDPIATPEPSAIILMGIGVAGAAFLRRRKMKSA